MQVINRRAGVAAPYAASLDVKQGLRLQSRPRRMESVACFRLYQQCGEQVLQRGQTPQVCGGSGQRWVRGGLYGETQLRPCSCQDAE